MVVSISSVFSLNKLALPFSNNSRHLWMTMLTVILLLLPQTHSFDLQRRFAPASQSMEELANAGAKRNWNNAAVGLWGKRSVTGGHFDLTEVHGPAVVKRPEDSWTKLNSLWGKRSSWQTANGLWGKRSMRPSKRFDLGLASSYESARR